MRTRFSRALSFRCFGSFVLMAGAGRLGFVGDIRHCNSFYERWTGFCLALGSAWIHSNDIGRLAEDMLLARTENPDRPFQSTYVKTTPLWRDSTARK